jgi:hypothetical protein
MKRFGHPAAFQGKSILARWPAQCIQSQQRMVVRMIVIVGHGRTEYHPAEQLDQSGSAVLDQVAVH